MHCKHILHNSASRLVEHSTQLPGSGGGEDQQISKQVCVSKEFPASSRDPGPSDPPGCSGYRIAINCSEQASSCCSVRRQGLSLMLKQAGISPDQIPGARFLFIFSSQSLAFTWPWWCTHVIAAIGRQKLAFLAACLRSVWATLSTQQTGQRRWLVCKHEEQISMSTQMLDWCGASPGIPAAGGRQRVRGAKWLA